MGFSKEIFSKPSTWARVGVATGAIALSGCEAVNNSQQYTSDDQLPPQVIQNYPELGFSNLQIQDSIPIGVSEATVDNLTSFRLNTAAAYNAYEYIEQLIHPKDGRLHFKKLLGENIRTLVAIPAEDTDRTAVILPKDAPPSLIRSKEKVDGYTIGHAFSAIFVDGDIGIFSKPEANATAAFTVEACQEMVRVAVEDVDGNLVTDPKETLLAQEIVCNSMGVELAARFLGETFSDCQNYVTSVVGYIPTLNTSIRLFLPFDEETYNSIIPSGAIVQ